MASRRTRFKVSLAGIIKRLVLGIVMALFALLSGWILVPPEAGTDQATVDWYSQ